MLVLRVLLLTSAVVLGQRGDRYHRGIDEAPRGEGDRALPDVREFTAEYWAEEADAALRERLVDRERRGRARNVVMFLGDGMSLPTIAAARALRGQREGRTGEEGRLSFELFPTVGLAKTYCVNAQVPDSSCTATAYLCGVKANQGTLGVTAAVPRWDCDALLADESRRVDCIAARAIADGRDAGVVTTTRVTHASPAGAYAHTPNRHWETDGDLRSDGVDPQRCPDIAHQLIHSSPGKHFKVILGGGRREFLPTTTIDDEGSPGRRTDGRNLIDEWAQDKQQRNVSHQYVWNRRQLLDATRDPPEYLLGLFESDHLQYHLEGDEETEPTLAELTEAAIRSLSRNPRGFFLFVEGGRIDHAHHDNLPTLALDETIELSKAVDVARNMLHHDDSLIVVTADHSHVMTYNGYSPRGTPILGRNNNDDVDGVPYHTLSYANGPGARRHLDGGIRPNVLNDHNYGQPRWLSHADVPLASETHGGEDVAVFAWGAQHSAFAGAMEQSQLPHLMAFASCLHPQLKPAECNASLQLLPSALALALSLLLLWKMLSD